jgi:hypothetical protein
MTPAPIFGAERQRLLDEYTAAVFEYLQLESARLAALAHGDEIQLEAEIEAARQRRDESKLAIKEHQAAHSC